MVEQITDIAKLTEDISSASKEQSVYVQQISESIVQISEVTQNNTTTAEEAASMSQGLSSQAELLKFTLAQFEHKVDS